MALKKTFSHIVKEEQKKEAKPTKLTVLDSKDPNTIYNLILAEKTAPKDAN